MVDECPAMALLKLRSDWKHVMEQNKLMDCVQLRKERITPHNTQAHTHSGGYSLCGSLGDPPPPPPPPPSPSPSFFLSFFFLSLNLIIYFLKYNKIVYKKQKQK